MSIDRFLEELESNRQRIEIFYESNRGRESPEIASEYFEELSIAIEELTAAKDELLKRNRELEASRYRTEREHRRYRELFQSAPCAYIVTDAAGVIREMNRAAGRLLGIAPAYSIDKPLIVFIPYKDRLAFRSRLNSLPLEADVKDWEIEILPRSGIPLTVSVNVSFQPPGEDDTPCLLWLIRDVVEGGRIDALTRRALTAEIVNAVLEREIETRKSREASLQESEARYRYLFEMAGVGMWEQDFSEVKREIVLLEIDDLDDLEIFLDRSPEFVERVFRKMKIIDVNGMALKICGAREKAELLGSPRSFVTGEVLANFKEVLLGLAGGETFLSGRTLLKDFQGNRIDVLYTYAFPSPGTKPERVIWTTERTRSISGN